MRPSLVLAFALLLVGGPGSGLEAAEALRGPPHQAPLHALAAAGAARAEALRALDHGRLGRHGSLRHPLLLYAASRRGTASRLAARRDARRADPSEVIGDALGQAGEVLGKAGEIFGGGGDAEEEPPEEEPQEEPQEEAQEGSEGAPEEEDGGDKKPLMSKINTFRAQLCWTREDLWSHEECMKFLGIKCVEKSTGAGVCEKFKEAVTDLCTDAGSAEERTHYCKMAKRLKIITSDEIETEDGEKMDIDAAEDGQLEGAQGDEKPAGEEPEGEEGKESKEGVREPDMDGDGIPDSQDPDRDGDGHNNEEDRFPNDANEWSDLDGDGIGDRSDPDRDGDGIPNEEDARPDDPSNVEESKDAEGAPQDKAQGEAESAGGSPNDGATVGRPEDLDSFGGADQISPGGDEAIAGEANAEPPDRDGDGVPDSQDDFPDDPLEWKDSDGDGKGDNADPRPQDPNCREEPCPEEKVEGAAAAVHKRVAPEDLNKLEKMLPSQGFDEHSFGPLVEHDNMYTWTGDWRNEWPRSDETRPESIARICAESPHNRWCERHRRRLRLSRRAEAAAGG